VHPVCWELSNPEGPTGPPGREASRLRAEEKSHYGHDTPRPSHRMPETRVAAPAATVGSSDILNARVFGGVELWRFGALEVWCLGEGVPARARRIERDSRRGQPCRGGSEVLDSCFEENGDGLGLGARLIRGGGEVNLLRDVVFSTPHPRRRSSGTSNLTCRRSGAETVEIAAWEVAGLRKGWRACARRGAATRVSGVLGEGRGGAAEPVGEPDSKHDSAAGSGVGRKLQWIDLSVSARRMRRSCKGMR